MMNRFIDYNYEEAYTNELNQIDERFIQSLLDKKKIKSTYATKTIRSGNQVEIEIYPQFSKLTDLPSGAMKKENKAQKKLNSKNARKRLIRLINQNFTSDDIWLTLTYEDKYLPESIEDALKNVKNYLRRLNNKRKKEGLEKLKYIYVTELNENVRCHHHIVMSGDYPMDKAEQEWKLGKRNEVRRLNYDENDALTSLAKYLTKDPAGKKRWCSSLNLKKPKETINNSTFNSKNVVDMARDYSNIEHQVRKKYKGLRFKNADVYYNDYNGRFYISCKLVDDNYLTKRDRR